MNNSNNQNEKKKPELPGENAEQKRAKINRAIYITAVVLLVSVALIAGIVSAANRAKKDPAESGVDTSAVTLPNQSSQKPAESTQTPESSATLPESTTKKPDTSVSNKLPEFKLPVSGTLSVFHDPDLQVFSPTMNDYRVHLGVDINTSAGASVSSVADGVVKKIWEDPMMGWCVAVAHDGEAISFYKNLERTLASGIKEGATVKAGQLLGKVGDSAMIEVAQEPHLHFEMTVKGLQVDPGDYFSKNVWAELEGDSSYEG